MVYRQIEREEENKRERKYRQLKTVMLLVKHSWTDIQNLLRQDWLFLCFFTQQEATLTLFNTKQVD